MMASLNNQDVKLALIRLKINSPKLATQDRNNNDGVVSSLLFEKLY